MGMILAIVGLLWLIWTAFKLSNPKKHSHLYLPLAEIEQAKLEGLEHEHIAEWYINETEALVIVKYQSEAMEEEALIAMIKQ